MKRESVAERKSSVIKAMVIKNNRGIGLSSAGFSLLEIIIILAILGFILAGVAVYAQKIIDEKKRDNAAEAVVQEVYGILRYVNEERINATISRNKRDHDLKIINPLYQQLDSPSSDDPADLHNTGMLNNYVYRLKKPQGLLDPAAQNAGVNGTSVYIARVYSQNISSQIESPGLLGNGAYSIPLKWGEIWGKDSVRGYFTDSGCQNAPGKAHGQNNDNLRFRNQFISCVENPQLRRSELDIMRVDFVNDKGTQARDRNAVPVGINRVDVYIGFNPYDGNEHNHAARIAQYMTPLMDAFSKKKLIADPNHIYLLRSDNRASREDPVNKTKFDGSNHWQFLDKNNGQPYIFSATTKDCGKDCAQLMDVADLVSFNNSFPDGYNYAIRFSFDGVGEPLRTDGLNSASRICWNTADGVPGPCLESPRPDLLTLKQRDNPGHYANLQVANLVSQQSRTERDGTISSVFNTVPKIEYKSFTNNGSLPAIYWRHNPANRNKMQYCKNELECCNIGDVNPFCTSLNYNTFQIAQEGNGAIVIPAQVCPDVDNFTRPGTVPAVHTLYPRLSVATSSFVAGIRAGTAGNPADANAITGASGQGGAPVLANPPPGFDNQENNMVSFSYGMSTSVHRLGGIIFQAYLDPAAAPRPNDLWRIAARVYTEDTRNSGHSWTYYNPPWLSVVVSTWCSSEPQEQPTP